MSEGSLLSAPGRARLEAAVALAALAILVPALAPAGAGVALTARRAGNPRWLAALLAALWCGLLGASMRGAVGMGLLP